MANTVTIKIKPETKALMERYGSIITSETGRSPTNDEIIMDALSKLMPSTEVAMIMEKAKKRKSK